MLNNLWRTVQVSEWLVDPCLELTLENLRNLSTFSPRSLNRIVILRVLVGIQTHSFTLIFFSCVPLMKSAQILQWILTSGFTGVFLVSVSHSCSAPLSDQLVPGWEQTAVRQEQVDPSCAAAATTSSSKRCPGSCSVRLLWKKEDGLSLTLCFLKLLSRIAFLEIHTSVSGDVHSPVREARDCMER